MINIDDIWKKNFENICESELRLLIDDRLWFVTDNIYTIGDVSNQEKMFDLVMLVIDSLNQRRSEILYIYQNKNFTSSFFCEIQSQVLREIDVWHKNLQLNWQSCSQVQNVVFLLLLMYAINIWLTDETLDSSKVMAKINELTTWFFDTKEKPLEILKLINFFKF